MAKWFLATFMTYKRNVSILASILLTNCSGLLSQKNIGNTVTESSMSHAVSVSSTSSPLSSIPETTEYSKKYYSFQFPRKASYYFNRDDGSVVLATNGGTEGPQDYSILINEFVNGCSPSITGASHVVRLENAHGTAQWGRVDYSERLIGVSVDDSEVSRIVCQNNGYPIYSAVYMLCAQKDSMSVVLCVNQMTDNPNIAKGIFDSFRWKK